MATSPDLPPPITPDVPTQPDPTDLPVEPDQGVTSALSVRRLVFPGVALAMHLTSRAPRQFMRVATYRWRAPSNALV